jgi:prepilin-type N-terminal cleavage/methylation domain-containing protein
MDLRQRWRQLLTRADDGFGMVELVVAMVIFSVIATAAAYGIMSATNSTRLDRNRIQAANLAARELEIARQEFNDIAIDGPGLIGNTPVVVNPHPLKGQTAGNPLSIDGLPFTLTRTAAWLPAGAGASACDGGSNVTYPVLALNVKVTWPRMGSTKPVESNTILSPRKKLVNGSDAFAAVKVIGADGQGVPNIAVTISDGGATTKTSATADDGCATFKLSNAPTSPKAFTAVASASGYVSNGFAAVATGSLSIKAGTLSRTSVAYDKSVALTVVQTTAPGFALPQQLPPITLYSPDIVGGFKSVASTGASTTVTGLWASSGGYVSWPGSCKQSDPAASGGTRQPAVQLAAGAAGTATHTLTPVLVSVVNGTGSAVSGAQVTAVPATAESGCLAYGPVVLGSTDANGQLATSLPAGTWTIRSGSGVAATPITVNASSGQQSVAVQQ